MIGITQIPAALQAMPPMPPVPPVPPIPFDPNSPTLVLLVFASLAALVVVLWPIARAIGRRLEGKGHADAALAQEIDQLHQRLGEVDGLRARLMELKERVDFTERLLARGDSAPSPMEL